jgi:hypothetical protein
MRRVLVLVGSAALVGLLGCGLSSYELRMQRTLDNLKYRQRLDANLGPAADAKFKELSVFVRPPKGLIKSETLMLSDKPGMFDLQATFFGSPSAPVAEGETAPPPSAPLRLHVLVRLKKKPRPTKGAPPPPATNRGKFSDDVRSLLAEDYANQEALSIPAKPITKRGNKFQNLVFQAGNNDTIQAWLVSQGNFDVALVWQIPQGVEKTTGTARELTLESFAVGPKAQALFAGGGVDDELGGGPGGESAGGGTVF